MVYGVWELVLFLWSHPIISCLVLLLFSPPLFPIIVYFSPLLVCTGLVAIAMISTNVGERTAATEDWRNGTERFHEPAVPVEMQVKPARETWMEWMKTKEEEAKSWVDNRFFNQDNWQFRNSSLAPEEPRKDKNSTEGCRFPSYRMRPYTPPNFPSIRIAPPQTTRNALPLVAEVAKAGNDISSSSMVVAGDIKPIPLLDVPVRDSLILLSSLEHRAVPSSVVPGAAVEEQVLKGEVEVPTPLKENEVQKVCEKEIASSVPDIESGGDTFSESVAWAPPVFVTKEVAPPIGISQSPDNALQDEESLLGSAHPRMSETPASVASCALSTFLTDKDQVSRVEALLCRLGNRAQGVPVSLEAVQDIVEKEIRNILAGAHLLGSRRRAVEFASAFKISASDEDRKASFGAETRFFCPSNHKLDDIQAPEWFTGTKTIIFVDERNNFDAVKSLGVVLGTGNLKTRPNKNSSGQIVMVETEVQKSNVKDRSSDDGLDEKISLKDSCRSEDGLDENIESCGNVPPTATTTISAHWQNSEPTALVPEVEGFLSDSKALVQASPYPDDLQRLVENLQSMMSPTNIDAAVFTTDNVLDKSYPMNANLKGEEHDDFTDRCYARKQKSLHTMREDPIRIQNADVRTNAVVPVCVPGMLNRVDRGPFAESLLLPGKIKRQPGFHGHNVESVESITARLQKKFTPNLGNDIITIPRKSLKPTRPAPRLPAIAPGLAPVESSKSVDVMENQVVRPIDGALLSNKREAAPENLPSKKWLTSFLSRQRERLMSSPLAEAFSNSSEGDTKGKPSSSLETVNGGQDGRQRTGQLTVELENQPAWIEAPSVSGTVEELDRKLDLQPVVPQTTLHAGETDNFVISTVPKRSSAKKLSFSWTKKKRCSEPQERLVDKLRHHNDSVTTSAEGIDKDESREIFMSPLTGFHSSSTIMGPAIESAHTCVPWDKKPSSEFGFFRSYSNSSDWSSPQISLLSKKCLISSWSHKTHPPAEESISVENKPYTSWWSKRSSREDYKAVASTSIKLPPTDDKSNKDIADRTSTSPQKSRRLLSRKSMRGTNNVDDLSRRISSSLHTDIIGDEEEDEATLTARWPWHKRQQSDSLPASSSGTRTFSRLRGKQTSLSEINLPCTLKLSPASSPSRAPDQSQGKGTSFSQPCTNEDLHHYNANLKDERNSDLFHNITRINTVTRCTSNVNTPPPTSNQIVPLSSLRTLDLGQGQLGVSPFQRNSPPGGAEISITDKLRVPLEEVLLLLSTGESDDQQSLRTGDTTGGAVSCDHLQVPWSSSSSEDTFSEEEWSATSGDEDDWHHHGTFTSAQSNELRYRGR